MSKIVMPDGSEIHCQPKDPPRIGICKFCGNTPRTLVPFSTGYNVYCEKCKAAGPIGMTMERAVELWNGPIKTDKDLADAFFNRIAEKGFKAKFVADSFGVEIDGTGTWELYSDQDDVFCEIDFSDGNFYRISGFTSGYWQDEVDWRKYR